MNTKILMVYPEIPNTYWSLEYGLSFVNKKSLMIPLGLITVASLLPEDFYVRLIDMNVAQLKVKDIENADLVFISSMIVQKNSFEKVVHLCKELGKPVVAGGPYPTSSYNEIENVDYFVLNEAEVTLPEFIKDYKSGNLKKIYRDETKPDIRETPVPRYDLLDVDVYSCMALQFSRGCPFNCEFCDIIEMFGRTPRTKDPEQFLKEMDAVYNTGFRGPLFIVDDNFIGNKKRVKELLRAIIEWQKEHSYPFSLFTEASINLSYDEELLDLMVDSGFNMVFIGIETPDRETLAKAQKRQNLREDIFESVKKIQAKGLEVLGGFIVGFDTDPEDIFDRQIGFIQKAGIPMAMVGILMPLPNTQLYRRMEKENRLLSHASGNNMDIQLNFIPRMPKDTLINGYKKIISEIYSPKKYFERSLTLLKRLPVKSFKGRPLQRRDIMAFFLSLVRQSFSSYGFRYLSFLFKALKYNKPNFSLAVNLAIKGYHFFKMTDEILTADEFSNMLDESLRDVKKQMEMAQTGKNFTPSRLEYYEDKLEKFKYKMRKRYGQLNRSVRSYLVDTYKDFEQNFEALRNNLNERYRPYNIEKNNSDIMLSSDYENYFQENANKKLTNQERG